MSGQTFPLFIVTYVTEIVMEHGHEMIRNGVLRRTKERGVKGRVRL